MADPKNAAKAPAPKPAKAPPAPATETPAEETNGNGREKKPCPITKSEFRASAPAAVQLGSTVLLKKEFATGTLGYFAQISTTIVVDGKPVKVSGNAQLYVPNSKEAGE